MSQVRPIEVINGEIPHDVIHDGCGHLDLLVAGHGSVRFESHKRERFDEFFEWHAVLQSERDRDGKTVHEAAKGRPFLVHVEEDFPQGAICIFPGANVEFMPADGGFLGIAQSPTR